MTRRVVIFLTSLLLVTVSAVLVTVAVHVRDLLSEVGDEDLITISASISEKFTLFDQALVAVDASIVTHMQQVLPAIQRDLVRDGLDPAGLTVAQIDEIAARYGLDSIYFVSPDFVVFNTNFEPDRGLDFKTSGFDSYLATVFASNEVMSDALAVSQKTGKLNSYSYYAPADATYLIEASIGLRAFVEQEYDAWFRGLVFDRLFQGVADTNREVSDVDVFLITESGGWSVLQEGKRLDDAIAETLREVPTHIVTDGRWVTVYQRQFSRRKGMAAAAPGETKAMVSAVTYDVGLPDEAMQAILRGSAIALVVVIPILLFLAVRLFDGVLVRPIRRLQEQTTLIAEGDLRTTIADIDRKDEIGDLARSFQTMQNAIQGQIDNLKRMNDEIEAGSKALSLINRSIERFVPRPFLTLLKKDSIASVDLGDFIAREMTVMFSDIRSFTALSEEMTPDQNFRFINNYFGRMGPIIRTYDGFIDKYIGDSIMALFETPDDALDAAAHMIDRLKIYNRTRKEAGRGDIEIGIGINTGPLMLGTVGEAHRLDGTVISDTVNLASRVEGLTKEFGRSIIITDHTRRQLQNPDAYTLQSLGKVTVKGKSREVEIFAVTGFSRQREPGFREAMLETYLDGVECMANRRYAEARGHFEKCRDVWADDDALDKLIARCDAAEASADIRDGTE